MSALHGFKRSNKADPSEISGQEMSLKEHIGEGAGELIQLFVPPQNGALFSWKKKIHIKSGKCYLRNKKFPLNMKHLHGALSKGSLL